MPAAMDTGNEDDGVVEIRPLPFVDIGGYRAREEQCKAEMETFNSKIAAATDEAQTGDAPEDESTMTGIITFRQQQVQQHQQQPHH
ncbi:hypothetical protein DFQ27_007637 [Actinomortierella ambigua]|uniref:Uncharacterized protein n=1 Tax=Actinomortierella ambigua TaxID=1343610 RepID=A0A9P6TYV7_9FUNG|nr:hypothetical protein DFQ27_007637 [Actinomortierella ambigua]